MTDYIDSITVRDDIGFHPKHGETNILCSFIKLLGYDQMRYTTVARSIYARDPSVQDFSVALQVQVSKLSMLENTS